MAHLKAARPSCRYTLIAKKTPLLGKGVFAGCNRKCCVLIVPQGTYCSYWLSSWGDFFINIKEQNNMNK